VLQSDEAQYEAESQTLQTVPSNPRVFAALALARFMDFDC